LVIFVSIQWRFQPDQHHMQPTRCQLDCLASRNSNAAVNLTHFHNAIYNVHCVKFGFAGKTAFNSQQPVSHGTMICYRQICRAAWH